MHFVLNMDERLFLAVVYTKLPVKSKGNLGIKRKKVILKISSFPNIPIQPQQLNIKSQILRAQTCTSVIFH